jgi:hypothetical protein
MRGTAAQRRLSGTLTAARGLSLRALFPRSPLVIMVDDQANP